MAIRLLAILQFAASFGGLSEFRKPLALVALADAPNCVIHKGFHSGPMS